MRIYKFILDYIKGERLMFFVLHWVTVWPLFVYRPNKFNFFALSIGSIIPDLEALILFLFVEDSWKARSIMHSILGAFTLDLIIVLITTIYIVPIIIKYMDRKIENKKVFLFSKTDLRQHKTNTKVIVYSGLIGTVSHVLIDIIHHPYNPLTFPIENYYSFNLILFNNLQLANILVNGGSALLFIIMIYYWYLKNLV